MGQRVEYPFRERKATMFFGGTATPFIVRYPALVKPVPLVFRGNIIDIMPTILDLAGLKYPGEYNGHFLPALPGESLIPVFSGKKPGREIHFTLSILADMPLSTETGRSSTCRASPGNCMIWSQTLPKCKIFQVLRKKNSGKCRTYTGNGQTASGLYHRRTEITSD